MDKDIRQRRTLVVVAVAVVAGALAFLNFGNINTNLVYYWGPQELRAAGSEAMGASIRLGGLVAPGSIVRNQDGLSLRFDVTDGVETIPVRCHSVPPAMFREGVGVVVEGRLLRDGSFESSRLIIKHDNEYQPPGGEDDRDIRELMRSLQGGETTGG